MQNNADQFEQDDDDLEFKSKTQIKKEAHALQSLGAELVDLAPAALEKIPLGDELKDAILLAKRINRKKEGFRRQLQYIGKQLRNQDATPIQQALDKLKQAHSSQNAHFHRLEKWRDQLLTQGDPAIDQLMAELPLLDRQKLRTLVRQANKQAKDNKPPKAAREIFQYLKAEFAEQQN